MDDREILDLAAKAYGIKMAYNGYGKVPEEGSEARFIGDEIYYFSRRKGEGNVLWNPLKDDGAALRLAVKLGLKIEHHEDCVVVWHDYIGTGFILYEGDACKATRRAIVLSAADIGNEMRDTESAAAIAQRGGESGNG